MLSTCPRLVPAAVTSLFTESLSAATSHALPLAHAVLCEARARSRANVSNYSISAPRKGASHVPTPQRNSPGQETAKGGHGLRQRELPPCLPGVTCTGTQTQVHDRAGAEGRQLTPVSVREGRPVLGAQAQPRTRRDGPDRVQGPTGLGGHKRLPRGQQGQVHQRRLRARARQGGARGAVPSGPRAHLSPCTGMGCGTGSVRAAPGASTALGAPALPGCPAHCPLPDAV